jgi:murein DD-endopeptidase MepM/ murein hydrolase activator NlpD
MKKAKNKQILKKYKQKYRFVVLNEDTLEEKSSFRLTRLNVLFLLSLIVVMLMLIFYVAIAYTPLKEYIPGYADFNTREIVTENILKTDSVEKGIDMEIRYNQNIINILSGNVSQYSKEAYEQKLDTVIEQKPVELYKQSKEDSILSKEVEDVEPYSLFYQESKAIETKLKSLNFFPPANGVITAGFDPFKEHYAIDIATTEGTGIKSTLDGRVIFANWNINTGYVIIIQHQNNLISVYKHNSVLLKKVGNFVRAGEVVAIVGNTGELSTGPHVHFELWYDGKPLNPEEYVIF